MFSGSAIYYDEIYASLGKDYAAEALKAHRFIQKHKRTRGSRLLDLACGTGVHAGLLGAHYRVEGLDLDRHMLAVARKKNPEVRFHQGDMAEFDLGRQFDAIVCLFSSIGYVKTRARLRKTLKNLDRHLLPGGVLLVEPWFTPAQWSVGRISITQVEKPELKIVRMSRASRKGSISILDFQYLIGTPRGIEQRRERHELGLFNAKDYLGAFRAAGFKVIHDREGLDGRGLYIGIKS
jgi:ubiquinone/menaquinone biosynthesis C-methylase UbiE